MKTLDLQERKAFQEKAEEGSWRELKIGGAVQVAPAHSTKFHDKLRRLERVYCKRQRGANKLEDLDRETQNRVFYEAMFGTVVLNWKGYTDGGEEFPFNEKNFLSMMEGIWEFSSQVMEEAQLLEEFEEEWRKEVSGN